MSTETKNPLAKAVKRILDFFRVLAFISLILWPLAALFMTIGHSSHPDTWGIDISVFSSFDIDLNEIAAVPMQSEGVRDPRIHGKADLNVDTSSLSAFYIFVLMMEIGGIVGFYMLLQYFGGQVILREYSLNLPGIELGPAFELNGGAIFIGLAMIVLSGVLNEAASINESHQLTI
jgi:hypothetical protein